MTNVTNYNKKDKNTKYRYFYKNLRLLFLAKVMFENQSIKKQFLKRSVLTLGLAEVCARNFFEVSHLTVRS